VVHRQEEEESKRKKESKKTQFPKAVVGFRWPKVLKSQSQMWRSKDKLKNNKDRLH